MSEERTGIVSDEEIQAALAEAQAQAAQIPNLDDGVAQNVVHVPVEPAPVPGVRKKASTGSSDPLPVVDYIPDAPPKDEKQPRPGFLSALFRQVRRHFGFRPRQSRRRSATAETPLPAKPAVPSFWSILYRMLDLILGLINRPFARLSAETRSALGLVAITTIVISVLAMLLLPRLMPPGDVYSKLERESSAARVVLEKGEAESADPEMLDSK